MGRFNLYKAPWDEIRQSFIQDRFFYNQTTNKAAHKP